MNKLFLIALIAVFLLVFLTYKIYKFMKGGDCMAAVLTTLIINGRMTYDRVKKQFKFFAPAVRENLIALGAEELVGEKNVEKPSL